MQESFHFFQKELTADICFIRAALLSWFGPEPPCPRGSLEDQLCGSILGSRTRDYISRRAFNRLALHFHGDWNLAAAASESEIHALIGDVTFAEKKAAWVKRVLENNKARNGKISFSYVAQLPIPEALQELEKNLGVKRKTSASALNFSDVRGRTFVIDTHVLRVLRRFGIVGPRARTEYVYDKVMLAAAGMTADDLFELHWHLKRLGQQFCSHSQVACESCPLSARCLRRLEPGTRIVLHVQSQKAW
jgi:endonuclease-3